jgi:hypothetical protein
MNQITRISIDAYLDAIVALRDALISAETEGENPITGAKCCQWEPIDTAPKDGREVLLYFPDLYRSIQIGSKISDQNDKPMSWSGSWPSLHLLEDRPRPTHWMPLPESPNDDPPAM